MRVFSKTANKMVDMMPCINGKTGKLEGFKESADALIMEPLELFDIPEHIDWQKVRVQTAMNAITGLCMHPDRRGSIINVGQIVSDAVSIADLLVSKLQMA